MMPHENQSVEKEREVEAQIGISQIKSKVEKAISNDSAVEKKERSVFGSIFSRSRKEQTPLNIDKTQMDSVKSAPESISEVFSGEIKAAQDDKARDRMHQKVATEKVMEQEATRTERKEVKTINEDKETKKKEKAMTAE